MQYMNIQSVYDQLHTTRIIPVLKIEDAEKAVPLAKALRDGGLPAAEVTFRTEAAEESIRRIARELPDVCVCAGTVLTPEQSAKSRERRSPGCHQPRNQPGNRGLVPGP